MRGFQSEMERDMKLEQDMLRQCEGELIHAPRGSLACYVKKGRIYFKHVYYLQGGGDKKSVRMERHLGKEDEALIRRLHRKAWEKIWRHRILQPGVTRRMITIILWRVPVRRISWRRWNCSCSSGGRIMRRSPHSPAAKRRKHFGRRD